MYITIMYKHQTNSISQIIAIQMKSDKK